MSEASEHDAHYRALGLSPGASLQEIEDGWRLRSAGFHPDKFPAASKDWATRKTQEINHARDELRRILREQREAPAAGPAYQPHIDRAPPEASPEPPEPAVIIGFRRASVLGSPEAGLDGTLAAGLSRRAVWSYATAALLALLVLVSGSAAVLRGGAGAVPQPDPAGPVVADRSGPPGPPASGDNPAALPPPPAANVAVAALATGVMPERSETSTEKPVVPGEPTGKNTKTATADPRSAASIDFPTDAGGLRTPNGPSPQQGPIGAEDDFSQILAPPPAASGHSFSGVATDQAERNRRDPLIATAIRACRSDRQRFCADVKPGGGRLAACAREHFKELSSGCSRALLALRDARQGQSVARSGQR